jgi:hypothetical protein
MQITEYIHEIRYQSQKRMLTKHGKKDCITSSEGGIHRTDGIAACRKAASRGELEL